ncbi:NADH dehydrogenase [ubiquinone] 1 alpha subcomplex assembly factor 5 [Desmophyllum pertusum]|uniref:NADH dehydrogenase [ubiquinone] 1 alpha subcomplex assembly factor 5 n=1 Tax=Desmophyllum pertusum TaxID=174260 RepID=A0A9W9Z3N1_9CNID|nr:NADH dehydrogenase [ubiquinone] 1 alpha subcomplex assembly factor 5 [Desmophyllum pertusum]
MAYRRLVSVFRRPGIWRCFSARRQDEAIMNVFDRKAKRRQKNRAALAEDVAVYDYLRDEAKVFRVLAIKSIFYPRKNVVILCQEAELARLEKFRSLEGISENPYAHYGHNIKVEVADLGFEEAVHFANGQTSINDV